MKILAMILVVGLVAFAVIGCGGGGGGGCFGDCSSCSSSQDCCGSSLCLVFNDGFARCSISSPPNFCGP